MPNQVQVMDAIQQQNEDEEIEFGLGGEWIVDDVQVGENTTVLLDDPNDPFWILLVIKCIDVIEDSLTDGWNITYEVEDVVICGY